MSITRVNTNFDAIFSTNALKQTERQLQNAMARISSGKRINYASDDPTGVGQLTTAKASLGGARQAQENIQQDLAMLQFMDGVAQNFEDKVIEMRDLAVRAANDATLSSEQQAELNDQFTSLRDSINTTRMNAITWNGKAVFNATTAQNFQVGGQDTDNFSIAAANLMLNNATIGAAAAGGDISGETIDTQANATAALQAIDNALTDLSVYRSELGQSMSRLEYALEEQLNMETNYAAAVSTIGDADMAAEISKLTTSQILSQSASAMLGQANIHSQTLLNILL